MKHDFYKDDGRWYINLPDYPGSREDLEMVSGADDMLDLLSGHQDRVSLQISEVAFPGSAELISSGEMLAAGHNYWFVGAPGVVLPYAMVIWLCDVTKFVFGDFPPAIHFKTVPA